jgi:mannitol-1-phosphate/altronate dehydrogenase
MTVKLSNQTLTGLKSNFYTKPTYNREDMKNGILHIGPSRFFRSHFAVFVDDILQKQHDAGEPLTWGITAVSLRHSDVSDALTPQDGLYTLSSKGKEGTDGRIIGSVSQVLFAQDQMASVKEAAASADTKIISLTVTQKGYYLDGNKGLDLNHPDIVADLSNDSMASTAIGLLVDALDARRVAGIEPPTILSLDNFPNNGTMLRSVILGFAKAKEDKIPGLYDWISKFVEFPNTMVDRITPGLKEDQKEFAASHGVIDAQPVLAEPMPNVPFVIEKVISRSPITNQPVDFPDFESVGAVVHDNVPAYEELKLRTLNGAHMALGCIGHLAKFDHTHQAIGNTPIRDFIIGFMAEAGQTLKPTDNVNQHDYRQDILDRLDNEHICDPLTRLARDGTKKIEGRVIETLKHCLTNQEFSHDHMSFTIASWIEYVRALDDEGYVVGKPRLDEKGQQVDPNDLNAIKSGMKHQISDDHTDPSAVFAIESVFGSSLKGNATIIREVDEHIKSIRENGIHAALNNFLEKRKMFPILSASYPANSPSDDEQPILQTGTYAAPEPSI